jgi:hypothetical protein
MEDYIYYGPGVKSEHGPIMKRPRLLRWPRDVVADALMQSLDIYSVYSSLNKVIKLICTLPPLMMMKNANLLRPIDRPLLTLAIDTAACVCRRRMSPTGQTEVQKQDRVTGGYTVRSASRTAARPARMHGVFVRVLALPPLATYCVCAAAPLAPTI